MSVSCHEPGENARLEAVDVLAVTPMQKALVFEQSKEVVRACRLKVGRVELFRELVERLGLLTEAVRRHNLTAGKGGKAH